MSTTLVSDEELIAQVRAGEAGAYGQLFSRHRRVAKQVAVSQLARRSNADDVVSDAFARVLAAIQAGKGPDIAFRPYLLTTVRRACIDHGRLARRETPVESFPDHELQCDPSDASSAELERSLAARAYRDLPERWRAVLWYCEVEQLKPAKFAPLMGLTPNAAAALAVRAREGLRDAYVQAHLQRDADPLCQPTVEKLGQYLRGSLSVRDASRVDEHLDSCGRCSALYAELQDSAGGLRAVIGVLILGAASVKWLHRSASVTWIKSAGPRAQAAVAGTTAAAVIAGAVFIASTDDARVASRFKNQAREQNSSTNRTNPSSRDLTPSSAAAGSTTTTLGPNTTASTPGDRPLTTSTIATETTSSVVETTVGRQVSSSTTINTTPPSTAAPATDTALAVRVESLGDLVRGRLGMFAVNVMNQGAAPANSNRLDVTINSGGPSLIGIDAPGWSCAVQSRHAVCDRSQVPAATASALYMRVSAPDEANGVTIDASITTSSPDANASDNAVRRVLPVWRTGLAPRFVARDMGAVLTVGNSVLTCAVNVAGCASAQQLAGPTAALANDAWKMIPIDTDSDPATATSSSAGLFLPSGADVLFAGLYWGGNLVKGVGGRAGDASVADGIRFSAPGRNSVGIGASMFERNAGHYQGFADVTSLVASAGSGNYTAGGVEVATGTGAYGGWSLVVVVRDFAMPMRNLAVYDGMDDVTPQSSAHMLFGAVSERANRSGEMSMVLYDGDAGVTGDSLSFDGAALADNRNPSNDFANSTIDGGLTRAPAIVNGFGLDIDRIGFRTGAAWNPSAAVRASTSSDRFTVGVLTLSFPV